MGSAVVIVGVVVLQGASGTIWWSAVRRGRTISGFEAVGMGLALGTFASMLSAMVLAGTVVQAVAWALPALVTVAAVPFALRRTAFARIAWPATQSVAVLLGLLSGLALLAVNWARLPLSNPVTPSYTDLYFFEALSRGLAEFGPGQSILMSGGSLRYHWFTYAWAGELAQTSSAASFVTLTRVLPLVTLVAVSALVAAWAGSLSKVRWVPSLAVLLVVAGGYTAALYGAILNFDSPSQSMTTLWLLALAVAFLVVVDAQGSRATIVVVAVLAMACTGGKVSHALVAAGGMALVVLVGLVTRAPWRWRALGASATAAVLMASTYVWVLAGVAVDRNLTEDVAVRASTWQGLDPLVGRGGVLLGTAALVLAIVARLAGLAWQVGAPRQRTRPATLFAVGAVGTGLVAMLVLSEGVNELWFVLAASAPGAVLASVGAGRAMRRAAAHHLDRPLGWAVVAAVPASAVALVLSLNWGSHQAVLNWLAPLSAWALVPVVSLLIAVRRTTGRRAVLVTTAALSVVGLMLTSIGTRPAALWTSSRPITTERGDITPQPGVGEAPGSPHADGSAPDGSADPALTVAAARWLADHTTASDVIATTDPLPAVVPALTGRQMYLAGDIYQVGLGRADELSVIEERQRVSGAIAAGTTPAVVAALCAADVTWIWVDADPAAAEGIGLEVVYANDAVSLLRLPAQECAAD